LPLCRLRERQITGVVQGSLNDKLSYGNHMNEHALWAACSVSVNKFINHLCADIERASRAAEIQLHRRCMTAVCLHTHPLHMQDATNR